MPARKRRGDLTVATAAEAQTQARAQAQIARLQEAAARGLRLHDWQAAARPGAQPPSGPLAEPAAAPAIPGKRPLWPFGRRADPGAERKAAILAELEVSVAGRPSADAGARGREAEAQPAAESLRAAG
jgi:hypothetical protein